MSEDEKLTLDEVEEMAEEAVQELVNEVEEVEEVYEELNGVQFRHGKQIAKVVKHRGNTCEASKKGEKIKVTANYVKQHRIDK